MSTIKIEMTIQKDGRWYRFNTDKPNFVELIKFRVRKEGRDCFLDYGDLSANYYSIAGQFERFRPMTELVRIAVRLLTRKAKQLYPDAGMVCHGPRYPTDAENEIFFRLDVLDEGDEIRYLIARLEELGLRI